MPQAKNLTQLPLVSVIIPTYNRSALLRETVESVLAQSYPELEVIVVDDGSTDDTPQVMQAYAGRIHYIRQQNRGGTAARNTGLEASSGRYLNFLDHDDLFMPEKIARQVALIESMPEAGLVHCGYYRMDSYGQYLEIINDLPSGDVLETLVQGCFLWSGAPLIRREVLDQVGPFDESVWSSDADMWLRIALAGYHFGCVQTPLGAYRILPDSSMADVSRTEDRDMAILERVFADPRLTDAARAQEAAAYFNQRFWLGFRYLSLGKWEDAQRNLCLALSYRPGLLEKTDDIIALILSHVLDPRIPDPVHFLEEICGHFPEEIEQVVCAHMTRLRGTLKLALALRHYGYGNIQWACELMTEAIALNPEIVSNPQEFSLSVAFYAMRLPVNAERYAHTVLRYLPPTAKPLRRLRSKIQSEISLARAFQAYWRGELHKVPALVLLALRYNLRLITNRGALSVFIRSLFNLPPRAAERPTGEYQNRIRPSKTGDSLR